MATLMVWWMLEDQGRVPPSSLFFALLWSYRTGGLALGLWLGLELRSWALVGAETEA